VSSSIDLSNDIYYNPNYKYPIPGLGPISKLFLQEGYKQRIQDLANYSP
jgi:hypothetical protein